MLGSVPGLHPLEASSTAPCIVMVIKNVLTSECPRGTGDRPGSTRAVMQTPVGRTLNKESQVAPGSEAKPSSSAGERLASHRALWEWGALTFSVNKP